MSKLVSELAPTCRLRFVERVSIVPFTVHTSFGSPPEKRTYRVLQQWWERQEQDDGYTYVVGEWRDVPVEKE